MIITRFCSDNTLAFNAATRLSLLALVGLSTCNFEAIFNVGTALISHLHQLSVAALSIYSSSSSLFWSWIVMYILYTANKKTPVLRGLATVLIPLILRRLLTL